MNRDEQFRSCTALAQSGEETPQNRAVAYYNRAIRYRTRGDNDRAIADYTEAIRLNPNYVNAYHNRGIAYHVTGDSDRAIADFSEAIRLNPSFAPAYSCRGTVYAGRKEYARAIADFSDAFRISSGELIPEDCDLRGSKSNPMPSPGGCDLAQSPLPCARYGTLVSLGRGATSLPPRAVPNRTLGVNRPPDARVGGALRYLGHWWVASWRWAENEYQR